MKQLLSALALSVLPVTAHALPPEAQQAWQEDLSVYARELEARHIDLFHTLSREQFETGLSAIRADLPILTEPELIARLMTLHHQIGDGHTAIPLWGFGYARFPVTIAIFEDGFMISGVRDQDAAFLGGVIEQINGRSTDEVLRRLAPLAPFVDNEGSLRLRTSAYLPVAALLHAVGLSDDAETLSLRVRTDAGLETLTLPALVADAYGPSIQSTISYRSAFEPEDILSEAPGLTYVYEPEYALGIIRIERYPSPPEMDRFAAEVVDSMRQSQGRNLMIDLRQNYGGDFYTGLRLAHQLNQLDGVDWRQGVYVLTSPLTFSAATGNAAQFSDILNARRVGEPTGANPCGYQDMGRFNLPNSNLGITYSKRHYCFAEPVNGALPPDIAIPITMEHWRNTEDAALNWVRSDIQSRQTYE